MDIRIGFRAAVFALTSATFFLLAACTPRTTVFAVPRQAPNPPRSQEFENDKRRFDAHNAPLTIDVKSYELQGAVDFTQSVFEFQSLVTLQLLKPATSIGLDAKGLNVHQVSLKTDGALIPLGFEWDPSRKRMEIALPPDLQADVTGLLTLKIDYAVSLKDSDGLMFVAPTKGDPVQIPALYTSSEPQAASSWMPCQDRPDDRAQFSISLNLPAALQVVSNGLASERPPSDTLHHQTQWKTAFEIPTYTMAFAVAEFEVKSSQTASGAEVSVWARKGLPVDFDGVIAQTKRQISTFESLLGAYPWEKYAIVLLPELGGGMENVSVTFNDEDASSYGVYGGDFALMAHELGHQWFGDFVTIKNWDDLWIKEGIATLLALEATREFEGSVSGRPGLGEGTWFVAGQAIYDESLKPEDKYNSGPYDRAAWLLNQLRLKTGNEPFWATLRGVLKTHALQSISTEELLQIFSPRLNELEMLRMRQALRAKAVPVLHIADGEQKVTVTLVDSENALLMPLDIAELFKGAQAGVGLGGALQPEVMSYSYAKSGESFLLFDRQDAHPDLAAFIDSSNKEDGEAQKKLLESVVLPKLVPDSRELFGVFAVLPSFLQGPALSQAKLWSELPYLEAMDVGALLDKNQQLSQIPYFSNLLCQKLESLDAERGMPVEWNRELAESFKRLGLIGLSKWSPQVSDCAKQAMTYFSGVVDSALFGDAKSFETEESVYLLSHITFEKSALRNFWAGWIRRAASSRVQTLALGKYVGLAKEAIKDRDLSASDREQWLVPVRHYLQSSYAAGSLLLALNFVQSAKDEGALEVLAALVDDGLAPLKIRVRSLCTVYSFGESSWKQILLNLPHRESYDGALKVILADPGEYCLRE